MGSMADLPRGDSPTLALVHPTEQEKKIQFGLNGVEWRGALPVDKYLLREEELSKQDLTKDGGITYWILVDTTLKGNPLDPTSDTRLPLASCESYRKKALVWQDGEVRETVAHGIGSVFCASRMRGKGYARRLMQEVGRALKSHQTEERECLFSILFSDIGKDFYARFGWEPFSSSHVSVSGIASESAAASNESPVARPLKAEDLEELCKIDEALVRKSLESRPRNSNTAVALIPDIATIRWHHARENFVGSHLHGRVPEIKGAIVEKEKGKRVWCYWTRMWYNENPAETKENTMHILRTVIEDEGHSSWEGSEARRADTNSGTHDHVADIAALLAMAQREAEEWKMDNVEAWNPSSATLAAARKIDPQKAKVVEREDESIASLQWYPPHEGSVADKIDWIGNEKYGWC